MKKPYRGFWTILEKCKQPICKISAEAFLLSCSAHINFKALGILKR